MRREKKQGRSQSARRRSERAIFFGERKAGIEAPERICLLINRSRRACKEGRPRSKRGIAFFDRRGERINEWRE